MVTHMSTKLSYDLASSEQVIVDLGARLERIRLSRNETQAQVALRAGVSSRTVVRLEKGEAPSLDTFVRVVQALNLASYLEALLPDATIRPIERVQHRGRERQRARPAPIATRKGPFRWGDA